MFRQDYLMRLIEQLGEAMRRIAGLRSKGDYDAALAEAEDGWAKLLDVPHELVDRVDTPTLASMLREPGYLRIAAKLLAEEAAALASKGDPVHASLRYKTAMELLLEARAVDDSGEDEGMLLELSRHIHANLLDARYRQ